MPGVNRARGSGESNNTTTYCERLFAALISEDAGRIQIYKEKLEVEFRNGRSGLKPKVIESYLRSVLASLKLKLKNAEQSPDDLGGDVKAEFRNQPVWFELKMQTKKPKFADLTQADYVREGTDFVRKVLQTHPEAMSALSYWTKDAIQATKRLEKGWDLWALLLADLCLLKDAQHRHKVGVKTPQDLLEFAKRKYLVLLTQEGTRWIKISDLALFSEVAKSKKVNLAFNTSNKTDLSIQIRGEHRSVDFTYHIGYTSTQVSGRHKLHAGAVARSEGLVEIRSAK